MLYGRTIWMLTKLKEKKLDVDCKRILLAVLNKSWSQHPAKQQVYSHLPRILKTIQFRRTRPAGHRWRSNDELMSDVILWIASQRWARVERRSRTYLQKLCMDAGCCLEDLSRSVDNRDDWRERVRKIPVIYIYIYIYTYTRIEIITAWMNLYFISSDRSDFHMINNLSIAVHVFDSRALMSFSVYETLLPR